MSSPSVTPAVLDESAAMIEQLRATIAQQQVMIAAMAVASEEIPSALSQVWCPASKGN